MYVLACQIVRIPLVCKYKVPLTAVALINLDISRKDTMVYYKKY